MTENRRNNTIAIVGTIVVHLLIILVLVLVVLDREPIEPNLSSGVYVQVGNTLEAAGDAEAYVSEESELQMEQVSAAPEVSQSVVEPASQPELITQNVETTVSLEEQQRRKEEEERRIEEEKKRREEERRQAEQQAAKEQVRNQMSGRFGTSDQTGNRGNSAQGEGWQGSPTGNAAEGALEGVGGNGGKPPVDIRHSFGNRRATLPQPTNSGDAVGTVIVEVSVDKDGNVVGTPYINPRSSTDENLRNAALEAARKAKFDKSSSQVGNQPGTITYIFKN